MKSYNEFMQEVVNLSDRERIRIGKQALSDTLKVLAKHNFDDENTALFVANLIKVFVSADRECNQEEYDIVRDIIGTDISEEDFYEMTNGGADPDFVAAFDRVIDCLTRDEKTPLCMFGLIILARDDKITPKEQELLVRLYE